MVRCKLCNDGEYVKLLEKKNKQLLERNAVLQSDLNQAKRDAKWLGK